MSYHPGVPHGAPQGISQSASRAGSYNLGYVQSPTGPGLPNADKIKRHEEYYLPSGDVIFLVENHLFRVHRYFFERESQYWRQRFSAPSPPGQVPKGSSDSNPWPLEGLLALDFSNFLWIFYNHNYSVFVADADKWISILKLSCDWDFTEVKRFAVKELESKFQEPFDKILLYHRYKVDKVLLIPSYIALAIRPEPLNLQEAKLLGIETALAICRAREFARGTRSGKTGHREAAKVTLDPSRMEELIRDIFLADPLEGQGIDEGGMNPNTNPNGIGQPGYPSQPGQPGYGYSGHAGPAAMNTTSHHTRVTSANHGHGHGHESPEQHEPQQYQQQYQQQDQGQGLPPLFSPNTGVQRELSQIWQGSSSPSGIPVQHAPQGGHVGHGGPGGYAGHGGGYSSSASGYDTAAPAPSSGSASTVGMGMGMNGHGNGTPVIAPRGPVPESTPRGSAVEPHTTPQVRTRTPSETRIPEGAPLARDYETAEEGSTAEVGEAGEQAGEDSWFGGIGSKSKSKKKKAGGK